MKFRARTSGSWPSLYATAALVFCSAAHAATCTVAAATLAFGGYNPVSPSPDTATASITVSCGALLGLGSSATVNYTLLLSAGGSGSVSNRSMTGSVTNLPYNIYTNGSYSTVWDNTTGLSGSITLVGLFGLPALVNGSDTQTVFGRILALQPVLTGTYSDALTITVNY